MAIVAMRLSACPNGPRWSWPARAHGPSRRGLIRAPSCGLVCPWCPGKRARSWRSKGASRICSQDEF
eukprot:3045851-Alexandrium_andersonii.AAC.1